MSRIEELFLALDERTLAREVGLRHDEARLRFRLERSTSDTFDEFARTIGDYYNYHFCACVGGGGRLSDTEAQGRAQQLLEREYQRGQRTDIVTVYNNAHDAMNGGLRHVLDCIADGLKGEAMNSHVRGIFDRYVAPHSWEAKVEIIRQFIDRCGVELGSCIQRDQPERYAQNYRELIDSYVNGLRQTSSVCRRL